ncbi:hypothetical protein BK126_26505 [Paenibacillus sp. FSL H7-0326]|nr:hypothetical protein BK126_26505 [Paenibacillus sp. FSL H7-0326]
MDLTFFYNKDLLKKYKTKYFLLLTIVLVIAFIPLSIFNFGILLLDYFILPLGATSFSFLIMAIVNNHLILLQRLSDS